MGHCAALEYFVVCLLDKNQFYQNVKFLNKNIPGFAKRLWINNGYFLNRYGRILLLGLNNCVKLRYLPEIGWGGYDHWYLGRGRQL